MKDEKKAPKLRFKGFTDDWEQRKLGDVADRFDNLRVPVSENLRKHGNIPYYGANGIQDFVNGYTHDGEYVLVAEDGANDLSNYPVNYVNGRIWVNNHAHVLQAIQGLADNQFLGYEIRRVNVTPILVGAGRYKLTSNALMNMSLNLPLMDEQISIASIFHDLDRTITLHEEKEQRLEHLKSALLQNLFADKSGFPFIRFKGYSDAWEQHKFVKVFDGLKNNTLSRADLNYESGTIKNVHYGDVLIKFGDYIDVSKTELPYVSDETKVDKLKSSFLQDGDIIIADTAEDGTVGKCTEIQGSDGVKIMSGLHTIACRPKKKYGPMFLGYYINSPTYHNQLKPLMQGIKVTSISKSALQDTDIITPKSTDEQIKIGVCVARLDHLITLHQHKIDNIKRLKQALLQKMFI